MRKQLSFILLILSISTFSFTQQKDKAESQTDIKHIIQVEFESQYGKDWQFKWNLDDTPHRIIGKFIPLNFDGNDPYQSELVAREFISKHQYLYGISEAKLKLQMNKQYGNLRYLIFNQIYENIPVWNGRIDFRYRLNGDLVLLGHDAYPFIRVNTNPSIDKDEAIFHAQTHVGFNESLEDEIINSPELYIWVERKKESIYHLAWVIELFVHSTDPNDELPIHRWEVFVDAHSGEILEKFDKVRQATLEGHVTGPVKDEPYGIATERGFPHVKVAVSGVGNTYTDETGYYSIDIGNSDRSVNIKLEGSYINTNNANGSDASITRTVSPSTTEDFSFAGLNSIAGERDTYYHANVIHDLAISIHSAFPFPDNDMPAKVNIGSEDYYWPCNAYWDYTGINLFSAGGGCAATDQMADVIYHEYGHGLQQFIYEAAGSSPPYSSSGLSEGCSDYWGMTLTNSPCLGNGFFGEGTCLRDGNNTLQYPANSCGGEVHCLGEYIMGALWKMRENLIESHGYENGVAISDNLFYLGQVGAPSSDHDFVEDIFLADDNDSNLENGTPNYYQICKAFDDHNLMEFQNDQNCDNAFAELEYSVSSLDFILAEGETSTQNLIISNIGEEGSILYYDAFGSPFSMVGDDEDVLGNYWSDSGDSTEINFDWVDITGMGTLYTFPHNDEAGDQIDIGFNFPFLSGTYNQCIINPNGWIGFGSDSDEWDNISIPSSNAPGPAIFGFWDDLNPVNDNCNSYCSGNVYYYGDDEKFIVWFNEVAHWWNNFENSYYDFQFVLYPDGDIDINYNTLTGTTNSATIGMQDLGGSNGIQVAFNDSYLSANLSLLFRQGLDWISVIPSSGEIEGGFSETLVVGVDASGLEDGFHEGYISIGQGWPSLPISMLVSGSVSLPGDINNDAQVNIQDIIILINFILGTDDPDTGEFNAADINSDGVLNIQDIILVVNLILD